MIEKVLRLAGLGEPGARFQDGPQQANSVWQPELAASQSPSIPMRMKALTQR